MKITNVFAYQIYDSRGFPTIACKTTIDNKYVGLAMVPSGASTGINEACELRDNIKSDWFGKGVENAINNINKLIAKKIINFGAFKQEELDNLLIKLDGSKNKNNLGANAILSVSLSYCKACANAKKMELFEYISNKLLNKKFNYYFPIPMVNVLNGGMHANNNFDFQELMIVPSTQKDLKSTLKIADECFLSLQAILKSKQISIAKGDEGGFSVNFDNTEQAFDLLIEAIKNANYIPGKDVFIALDIAASEFYNQDHYEIHKNNTIVNLNSDEMISWYEQLISKYPIISIEDPFDENDWDAFIKFKNKFGNKIQIVGDDLFCTNSDLLKKGIELNSANAILIKLNQIGTLTECIKTINLAHTNNIKTIISHRSGETEDTFISDFAIAMNSKQIKTGSFSRSERLAKYNRLLEIDNTITKLKSPIDIRK